MTISRSAARAEHQRQLIGVWTDWPEGAGWANEGMTRLLGFIIEGAALEKRYKVQIFVLPHIHDEVVRDLSSLRAVPVRDYEVVSTEALGEHRLEIQALIRLGKQAQVRSWLVLYPYMDSALELDGPLTVILPDANPISFPSIDSTAWDEFGEHTVWSQRVRRTLQAADRVITFSNHVAYTEAEQVFGMSRSKIEVVPHAPPTLSHLLPFATPRAKSPETVSLAADLIRTHCASGDSAFLSDYPFEESRFFVVSTQDRTTKNIACAAEALRHLLREKYCDLRMITTAPIHFGAKWTRFPEIVGSSMLASDVVSLTRLPRPVHAALMHCAAFVVHPSLFEGGRGPFPFYEAVSVGTPCLMAEGPHVRELIDEEPELAEFTFDPHDPIDLSRLIKHVLGSLDIAIAKQRSVLAELEVWDWRKVSAAYLRPVSD